MSSVMRFDEWQDSDGNPVFNGAGGVSPGGLVAVKSAIFTGAQVESSIAPGANFAVTDLSITHEVADASNRLIISAFFGAAGTTHQRGTVGIAIDDGAGLINMPTAPGNRQSSLAGGLTTTTLNNQNVTMPGVTFVHTPGAGSKTYTVRAVNLSGSDRTMFVNRSEDDTNSNNRFRAVSSLVIQEVAV